MNIEQVRDPEFWRQLSPDWTITEDGVNEPIDNFPDSLLDDNLRLERIRTEGYIEFPELVPADFLNKLHTGIERLRKKQIIPVFGFVYDDFWEVSRRLTGILQRIIGKPCWQLPDFWVWYLDPHNREKGWSPHRDRKVDCLMEDGMPKSLTVWVALSDATPLNGCMYLVPANMDPDYLSMKDSGKIDWQTIRALPATAGTVLIWNQRVIHWGGSSSPYAETPRISLAYEFQRSDVPPYNTPVLSTPYGLLSFEHRLKLVAKQILQYTHMYNYSPDMVEMMKTILAE